MSERDRMLAEGPRVAPEPGTADDTGRKIVPQTTRRPTPPWVRVLPAVVVALFVAISAIVGGGHNWGWAVFVILAIVLQLLVRRRKR
jgi:hypothetical protein